MPILVPESDDEEEHLPLSNVKDRSEEIDLKQNNKQNSVGRSTDGRLFNLKLNLGKKPQRKKSNNDVKYKENTSSEVPVNVLSESVSDLIEKATEALEDINNNQNIDKETLLINECTPDRIVNRNINAIQDNSVRTRKLATDSSSASNHTLDFANLFKSWDEEEQLDRLKCCNIINEAALKYNPLFRKKNKLSLNNRSLSGQSKQKENKSNSLKSSCDNSLSARQPLPVTSRKKNRLALAGSNILNLISHRLNSASKLSEERSFSESATENNNQTQEYHSDSRQNSRTLFKRPADLPLKTSNSKSIKFLASSGHLLRKRSATDCQLDEKITPSRSLSTSPNILVTSASTPVSKSPASIDFDTKSVSARCDPISNQTVPAKRFKQTTSKEIGTGTTGIRVTAESPDRDMSLYDCRMQPDDRVVPNCYVPRNSHSSANDENSYGTTHHYSSGSGGGGSGSSSQIQPQMATLCNIGNTCYLNSVVYTLRFAPLFLHNLHHLVEDLSQVHSRIVKNRAKSSSLGRNISGLHMENPRSWSSKDLASLESSSYDLPKSNQQIATEKLHELYQNLHKNEVSYSTEPFHADTFLHAIQEVSSIFEGNQQQDAHEFLMCVLDSIRETCQALIKAITECPDVISNVCVSLPEQAEPLAPSSKDHHQLSNATGILSIGTNGASTATNITTASGTVQQQQSTSSTVSQRESSSSSGTGLIKTKLFSRKSKRKDESKNSKNSRINSPRKDNTADNNGTISGTTVDGGTTNNSKNSLSSSSTTDDDFSAHDKDKLSEKIKKLGLDFFTEDFEGITVSKTKCLSCETVTEQKETMIDIAVPIPNYDNLDKKDANFIQNSCTTSEYFSNDNKYRCEQCMGYTEAIRSISYEVLPRLLVIQLSRFSGGMEKINSYLPTQFTLECFCAKCCKLPKDSKLHVYKLYSVITHVGATMSVGHYIAYTKSLDFANDYLNCPKDCRRQMNLLANSSLSTGANASNSKLPNSSNSSSGISNSEKNLGLMKKIIFGRSKASSSGDVTKNMKNINGLSTKAIANGIDKLNVNTPCPSVNCCSIKMKNNPSNSFNSSNSSNLNHLNGGLYIDLATSDNASLGYHSAVLGNNGSASSINSQKPKETKPIWYMCDDDKIKAMTQMEFEDLLSPNRKIMITPYLLFYARSDLQ